MTVARAFATPAFVMPEGLIDVVGFAPTEWAAFLGLPARARNDTTRASQVSRPNPYATPEQQARWLRETGRLVMPALDDVCVRA